MKNKTVKDAMVYHILFITPATTLREAASIMKDADCAILPVGSPDKLEGVITDHDLVIHALTNGGHANKLVGDYMDRQVTFCHEDDTLEVATDKICKQNLYRLLVKDAKGHVTGILSLVDILKFNAAQKHEDNGS